MNLIELLKQLVQSLTLLKARLLARSSQNAPEPTPAPENTPSAPPSTQASPPTHISKIEPWAKAIQRQEGGSPLDLNMRLNNPGNLKYSGLTAALGGVRASNATDGGSFCRFPTYEAGFNALCKFLRLAATDQLKSYRSTMSLELFTAIYANPPKDHPYGESVAKELGVPVTTPIYQLL
jgi:hypothetical protein